MYDQSPARIAELLDAYLGAYYRWESDAQWRWLAIGEPAPEADALFPHAQRYALLSAWDPYSVPRDKATNKAQDAQLRDLLAERGFECRPGFSSAPDRSWREPGWLVLNMPTDQLDALARHYGQLGTLAWERGERVRLRMDACAPPHSTLPWVDWLHDADRLTACH